jgi:hypothetical protein
MKPTARRRCEYGVGAVIVFVSPLLGSESPAYPDSTNTLALAGLLV